MEDSNWLKATINGKKGVETIKYNNEIYLRSKGTFLNSIKKLGKVALKKEDIPKYLDLFKEDNNFSLFMFNEFSFEKEISFNKKELEDHADIKTITQLKKLIKNLKNVAKETTDVFKPILVFISELETILKELELEKRARELEKRERELEKLEKLHKQPRNLLKTVAKTISKTTSEPNLFTAPQILEPQGGAIREPQGGAIGELKEEISKNTGALAFYLIQKYQENNNKPIVISNLNSIAEVLNCNNYRLKLYLLYLGGYVYPLIDKDEQTKELVLTNEQLFKIEFRYGIKIANKYPINENGNIEGVERIGNNFLNFIKDEPLDRVVIIPNEKFIKAMNGSGLGNILTVNNKFVGLILQLTDIATKILCYSSSNQPSHKIKEDNLIKHLGLKEQTKKQGKPRVRATILKGLQELKDKQHIKSYSYEEDTGMYKYIYSDKYVKYKERKRVKKKD